jgi:ABC-type Fe2+-enterobactin transport system substrate-binding protein
MRGCKEILISAFVLIMSACRDDKDPEDGFAVRGNASGLLGPVALELRADDVTETLMVAEDGTFVFEALLPDGASYTVRSTQQEAPCTLKNEAGTIDGADAVIALACVGPSITSIEVSGVAPEIELVPGTVEYSVDMSFLRQSTTVTATVTTAGDRLTILGASVPSGEPSTPITLNFGDNAVNIVVENRIGWQQEYRLTLRRVSQPMQYAYVKPSNTSMNDQFGYSVAVSGDLLAVGAAQESSAATGINGDQADDRKPNSGAVYVFRRSGTDWAQEAYIKPSNTDANDLFGLTVAFSGDTLVVGAPGESSAATGVNGDQADNSALRSGAVYVFRRIGTSWQQEAYIKASNTDPEDSFGQAIAISGDTFVVGAASESSAATGINGNQDDNTAATSGAVYIFRYTGAAWQQEAYIKASNAEAGDGFGASLALSGEVLAASALAEDSTAIGVNGNQADNSARDSGAVYVFRRTGTAWRQEAYVKASNTDGASPVSVGDHFGYSVAVEGDVLAIGAQLEASAATGTNGDQNDNSAVYAGAAYVFRRTDETWHQESYIKASNTSPRDLFGGTVALRGDMLAVGAWNEASAATGINGNQDDESAGGSGAVYVFRYVGTSWQQVAYVKASNTDAGDEFSISLAISDDTLVAGTYREASAATGVNGNQDDNSAPQAGAVYIFH